MGWAKWAGEIYSFQKLALPLPSTCPTQIDIINWKLKNAMSESCTYFVITVESVSLSARQIYAFNTNLSKKNFVLTRLKRVFCKILFFDVRIINSDNEKNR